MATAGRIVVDLIVNGAGVGPTLARAEAQIKNFETYVARSGVATNATANATLNLQRAEAALVTATERLNIAQLRNAQATFAVQAAKAAAANADISSAEKMASSAARVAGAQAAQAQAAQRLAAAELKVAEAQELASAARVARIVPPATVTSTSFPMVTTAASLASLAMLKFGHDSVEAAVNFEFSMRLLQTQARTSHDEVVNMSEALLQLAPFAQRGPEELAKALYHIESVGYRGAKALAILTAAAKGAAIGGADLEAVTNALVGAVATGIKGTEDFSKAMGTLDATVGVGNISMQQLTSSLSSGALATFKQFGLTLTDFGAALATMADQAIPPEEASTRLRITVALLAAPTRVAAQELAKVGLSSRALADEMRGPNGLIGALTLLKSSMDAAGLDAVQQSQLLKTAFGGSRSSAGIMTLVNSSDLLKQKFDMITNSAGKFDELFAEEQTTAKANLDTLNATLGVLAVRIGNAVLPIVIVLSKVLGEVAKHTTFLSVAFIALTAVMTTWAIGALARAVRSGYDLVASILLQRTNLVGLDGAFKGSALSTETLNSAEEILAGTLKMVTPILTGAATATASAGVAAGEAAAGVELIVPAFAEAALASEVFQASMLQMVATTEGSLVVMRQMAATTPVLVAGFAGANGAIAATAASTGPLIVGTQAAAGAQEVLAASAGPVITTLEAETLAMGEATVAAEALTIAQGNLARSEILAAGAGRTGLASKLIPTGGIAERLVTDLKKVADKIALVLTGAFTALSTRLGPIVGQIGSRLGSLLGTAMGLAIPAGVLAIVGVLGVKIGQFAAQLLGFIPDLDKAYADMKEKVSKALEEATYEDLQRFHKVLEEQIAEAHKGLPGIGLVFDVLGVSPVHALEDSLAEVDEKMKALADAAGVDAGDGFAHGLTSGDGAIHDASEDAVQVFGTTMAGVKDAAMQLGADAMDSYAKGVADAEDAPTNAFKNLITSFETEMSVTAQIALEVGFLTSTELARGLASADPKVVAAAEVLRAHAIARLDAMTGGAYTAGTDAGIGWSDAFAKSLRDNGASEDDIQAEFAKMTPEDMAAAEAKFASLGNEWRNHLAPSAKDAASAVDQLRASMQGASVSDQATQFVEKFGDDIGAIKKIAETSGGDLMDAIAKGIKDKRDAPLDALKELHTALTDQFDRNREIALLWAELQSKDMADGLKSGDPYVQAVHAETLAKITARMDELTGGTYSQSLGLGTSIGRGLADSSPVVGAGAVAAVEPIAQVVDATNSALGAFGFYGGASYGQGFASAGPEIGAGAVTGLSVIGTVVDATNSALGAFGFYGGQQYGVGIAGGMASVGGVIAGVATTILNQMNGSASFADTLQNALKGAGDMTKYLNDQLNKLGTSSSAARSDMTTAFADIKASAEEYFQAVHDKTLQAIHDAHDHKNALLEAKEALNQKPVTAAQKALDFQRQAQQEWRLRKAVAEATDPASRRDAVLALEDFLAQKHIDMMQDEVDAAEAAIEAQKDKNDQLEKDQVAAENKRYENQKKDFARELAALQRFLASHPQEWRNAQSQILTLLDKYGVSYNAAGAALGSQFAAGIRSQVNAAYEAAKALAAAGAGTPPSQLPPPPPAPPTTTVPPAPAPPADQGGGGGGVRGGSPIPLAIGSWQIMKDNFLALLHKDEMVLPKDMADLVRSFAGRSSSSQTLTPALSPPSLGSPTVGRPDVSRGASRGEGGHETIIVQIGEHVVAEIVDRALSQQDNIYGQVRVTTGSRR